MMVSAKRLTMHFDLLCICFVAWPPAVRSASDFQASLWFQRPLAHRRLYCLLCFPCLLHLWCISLTTSKVKSLKAHAENVTPITHTHTHERTHTTASPTQLCLSVSKPQESRQRKSILFCHSATSTLWWNGAWSALWSQWIIPIAGYKYGLCMVPSPTLHTGNLCLALSSSPHKCLTAGMLQLFSFFFHHKEPQSLPQCKC